MKSIWTSFIMLLMVTSVQAQEWPQSKQDGRKLVITIHGDQGVAIERLVDNPNQDVLVLQGPVVEIPLAEGYQVTVDDANYLSPKGKFDFDRDTVTFFGDLVLELEKEGKAIDRITVAEATVIYHLKSDK